MQAKRLLRPWQTSERRQQYSIVHVLSLRFACFFAGKKKIIAIVFIQVVTVSKTRKLSTFRFVPE
jgi:hypothetical protein